MRGGATRPSGALDWPPHQGSAMHYVYLGIAVVAEAIGTSSLSRRRARGRRVARW